MWPSGPRAIRVVSSPAACPSLDSRPSVPVSSATLPSVSAAGSISEVSRQVQQSTEIAGRATERAKHTDETVRGLQQAAQKIGDVVNLIRDISEQTNLLALNATIEAARAGEAGKGFAVVANEVKELARQTAKATEDIRQQIGEVQGETERAVEAIDQIVKAVDQVSEVAASIARPIVLRSMRLFMIFGRSWRHSVRRRPRPWEGGSGRRRCVRDERDRRQARVASSLRDRSSADIG